MHSSTLLVKKESLCEESQNLANENAFDTKIFKPFSQRMQSISAFFILQNRDLWNMKNKNFVELSEYCRCFQFEKNQEAYQQAIDSFHKKAAESYVDILYGETFAGKNEIVLEAIKLFKSLRREETQQENLIRCVCIAFDDQQKQNKLELHEFFGEQ